VPGACVETSFSAAASASARARRVGCCRAPAAPTPRCRGCRHSRGGNRRQALEVGQLLAGDFRQRLVGVVERGRLQDGGGARAVVAGAGLVHVGDRRQADLQALLGLVELALDGGSSAHARERASRSA
jgi:hypothetical protein